jgi:hypothetical protein
MASKLEISAKRVLFFTKLILTFLVISILIFLNYLDLKETNRNRVYLCLLRDVYTASESSDLKFENYELERLLWLGRTNAALQKKHSDSRIALVSMLNNYGANIGAKEKGSGTNPNIIILMSNSRNDNIKKDFSGEEDALSKGVFTGYTSARTQNFGTVSMALDSFLRHEPDDTVYLLTGIDTLFLKRQLDSLLKKATNNTHSAGSPDTASGESDERRRVDGLATSGLEEFVSPASTRTLFTQHWKVQGLALRRNMVYLSLQPNAQFAAQTSPDADRRELAIPAKCDSLKVPSILRFAGFDTVTVHELAQSKNKQRELLNLYGSFNLDFIDNLSSEAFNKNNNAISILGFDISRKWFPFAMFILLLVIYTILFKTIRGAASSSSKIISGYESDDVLDFLVDNKWMRFIIWVLTPVFLVFLVLYSTLINYNIAVYVGMIAAGVTSLLLGWIAFTKSLRL